jgi:hypothetical protein
MKKANVKWFLDYWKEVLLAFFAFFVLFIATPAFIYHIATIDPELKNTNLRNQLEDKLAKEMKEIPLPPKTTVNRFQSRSKNYSILVSTRYRTELSEREFVGHFVKELEKTGWVVYRVENIIDGVIHRPENSNDYNFCRGNQHAALNYEGEGGLKFRDGGNYYNLAFTVGLYSDFNNSRPPSCR